MKFFDFIKGEGVVSIIETVKGKRINFEESACFNCIRSLNYRITTSYIARENERINCIEVFVYHRLNSMYDTWTFWVTRAINISRVSMYCMRYPYSDRNQCYIEKLGVQSILIGYFFIFSQKKEPRRVPFLIPIYLKRI